MTAFIVMLSSKKNCCQDFSAIDVFELLVLQFHEVSISVWCVIFNGLQWKILVCSSSREIMIVFDNQWL
jgi:hypothetical protein